MPEADGYAKWRTAEAADLASLVQRRLVYLQNPPDCENARKIVCNLNKVIHLLKNQWWIWGRACGAQGGKFS